MKIFYKFVIIIANGLNPFGIDLSEIFLKKFYKFIIIVVNENFHSLLFVMFFVIRIF